VESAAVSYWKGQELRRGVLSVKELVHRADTIEHALRRALGLAALSYWLSVNPSAELTVDWLRLDVCRVSVGVLKEMAVLYPAMFVSGHGLGKPLPARPCEPALTRCRSCA
jgi:hypothetical protein